MSPAANNRLASGCCGLLRAVSKPAETANTLIFNSYSFAVSLFHDFRETAAANSNWRFRPWLAQLELRALFSENSETAQQRPISTTKAESWLFQPALEQPETVRNSRPSRRAFEGDYHA